MSARVSPLRYLKRFSNVLVRVSRKFVQFDLGFRVLSTLDNKLEDLLNSADSKNKKVCAAGFTNN